MNTSSPNTVRFLTIISLRIATGSFCLLILSTLYLLGFGSSKQVMATKNPALVSIPLSLAIMLAWGFITKPENQVEAETPVGQIPQPSPLAINLVLLTTAALLFTSLSLVISAFGSPPDARNLAKGAFAANIASVFGWAILIRLENRKSTVFKSKKGDNQ